MSIEDIISKNDLGKPYNYLMDFNLADIFEIEKVLQGRQMNFNKCLDINNEFKELIDTIGNEKVQKIVDIFYGKIIYFPKIKETCKQKIKNRIVEEFNGYNYTQLAKKYGYTERYIRKIIKYNFKDDKVLNEQLNIFDYLN